jgi:hypothetical protein
MTVDATIDTGQGDLSLIPCNEGLGKRWQHDATLTAYAPTGEYELGELANPGLNHWSFDPIIGVSNNHNK